MFKNKTPISLMKAVDDLFNLNEIQLGTGVIDVSLAKKVAANYDLEFQDVIDYAHKCMGNNDGN